MMMMMIAPFSSIPCLRRSQIEEQGIDPNLRDSDGASPLHFAASRGHVNTVIYLLEHGGSCVAVDKFGKTPLNDAAENEQVEVSNYR